MSSTRKGQAVVATPLKRQQPRTTRTPGWSWTSPYSFVGCQFPECATI